MSRILCVIDGMTDPHFQVERYGHLASMGSMRYVDTCGGFPPETLHCVLRHAFERLLTKERCMLLWGQSVPVALPPFPQKSAVICGKELVKGIARLLHMELFPVKGATGDVDTDLDAKTEAALRAAERCPFVLLHINGADEAAHRHDSAEKETFLRRVDDRVLSRLLASEHEIVVASDHGADPESGAHLGGPQPFFTSR